MPEGACASQTEGARSKRMAHVSFCMQISGFPKGARTCRTEGVRAQGSTRGPNGGRSSPSGCTHANLRERMPRGARAGQAESAQARMSACVPNGGRPCQTDGARDQGNARVSNGGRTFPRENLCFLGLIWGFQSKILVLPQGIWGFQRESMHAKLSAHVPKVARAGQTEGVQARGGARMRIGGNPCPREHAHAKRRAHIPKGGRPCLTVGAHAQGCARKPNGGCTCPRESLGFLGIIRGFQSKIGGFKREPVRGKRRATCPSERARANRRAQIPNISRACRREGTRSQSSARLPNEGCTCPK